MRRANIVVAVSLACLAIFFFFEAGRLNFGSMRVPQTGFFPKTLLVLVLVLSLCLLVQTLRQAETETRTQPIPSEGWIRIGATLATLLGFALLLEWLGFFVSTFLLMVLLLRAIEAMPWAKVVLVALSTALIAYCIFAWLLGVPLPAGVLGI
jgi:putative tricarboxylic transport membrane protein